MNKSTTSPNSDVSRASHFERARIRTLAAELEKVQKKTFTKWVNSCLSRVGLNIDNLYSDLCDGTALLRLLEVLSGEKLPKPARGRMRIHLIQNLNAVLKFLIHKHVKLENIGAHDIVDGNQRIILGLIWTIILRFQIQDIRIEGETTESTEKRSAKDALLVWCKLKTANYTNVRVTNFTSSWRNGLAFNALIHKHRPDVVDYDRLSPDNALENLRLAFTVADECFGIAPLLDAEDICVENPDEKSIMTYVASYYQSFSKLKAENVVERRIWKVMNCIMDLEKMMQEYDTLASNLLKWIRAMIVILSDRQFENNLDGVQRQLSEFKTYRTVDKPLRYLEKGTLEEKFFTIQSKLRSNNRKGFIPVADKTISDINKSWEQLENAEHDREQALREEIIRQERLERLADKFTKKAEMRVQWICDSVRLVDNDIFGDSGSSVSAALKKQEAFEADVYEYQKRIRAMEDLVQELKIGNYHAIQKIQDKRDKVIILWNELLELIKIREGKVSQHVELHDHIQELEDFMGWSRDVKNSLESEDYGLELHDVEDLLQKNLILENEILAQEEPLTRALLEAENFKAPSKEDGNPMNDLLKERINSLSRLYDQISELLYIRKTRLEDSRQLLQFYQNVDDELDWMKGKNQSLSLTDLTKATDCSYVIHKLRSHQALEAEVNNNETLLRNIIDTGNQLSKNNNYDSSMILSKINNLASAWNNLVDSMSKRKDRIAEILSMQQFLSEADYLEGQISLHTGLLSVDQNRIDEDNIDSLLKHHANLEFEVENYKDQLHLLDNMADDLNPNDQSFEMALGKKAVITEKYQVLMAEVGYRREKLIAQQSLFRYLSEIDIVFSWIGDKEAVLFSFEPPTNLIEAELILQKFKGIERDIVTYQDRYNNTMKAGNDLAVQITDGNDEIANAQGELNEKWIRLLELHGLKKEELSKLLILLRLFYEVDEVKNWIADKGTGLSSCSYTTDPAAVLQMQRQINVIERETPAIEERIEDVESKRDALAEEQPDKLEIVNDKLDSLYEVWDDLRNLVRNQVATIGECSNIQKLMFDVEDLEDWLKFQLGQLSLETDGLNSLPDVEKLQVEHNELLEEFTNRKIILDRINSTAPMHYTGDAAGRRLEQRVEDINHDWNDLDSLCHKRKVLLQQIQQYLIFQRDCKYIEGILQKQDVFLAEVMTELGTSNKSANQLKNKDDQHLKSSAEHLVSLADLQELTIRQKDYCRGLDSCIQRVAQADQFAKLSVDDDHYAKESLMSKAATLSERVERNRGLFTEIAFRLDKAVHLQSFYQRCNELIDWINEKFNIISGDIVTDQAYISRLLQKHRTFEAELTATRDQKNVVNELGKSLVQDQPDARPEVEIHLTDIEDRWITLMDACSTRSQLLTDRYNEVQFIRIIDNLQAWMSDAENTLANMETCKDLASCNKSMTKLTSLESDIISRKDRLDQLEQQVQNFLDINHRGADDMQDLFESVSQRYAALQRPLKERRKLLEASRRMFQFYRDVDDELLWIEDKKQQLQSNETGNNLHEVQILRTVQQNIQNEIRVHEQIINEIFKSGSKVISDADSSADKIRHNTELLKEKWLELEICSREREAIIEQSATAHKLLFDTEEMEGWIMEKAAILITKDKPKDQIRAMSMMKHHELLEQSVKSYAQNIKSLHQSGQAFLDQSTIKSKEIVEALDVIDDSYNSLLILASERRNFIDELLRFYRYNAEVDEVERWIKEREVFSKSKDYGSNLEQIQRIAETFHSWVVNTKNSGVSKVKEVNLIADQLIITGHPEAATICEWKSGINDLWNQLLETIQERTKNIENVATIRDHYAAGNDFLHRIRTKGQCLPDDLGNNFDSTECLLHRHSIVQSDVLGIELEYNNLQEYAAQLKVDFPNEKQAIDELHGKISDAWELLKDKCNWRKSQLEQTLDLFRLLLLVENHALWINDMYDDINSLEDPSNAQSCTKLMSYMEVIKEEIEGCTVKLDEISEFANSLVNKNHYLGNEIIKKLDVLQQVHKDLRLDWKLHYRELELILGVLILEEDMSQGDKWLCGIESNSVIYDDVKCLDRFDEILKGYYELTIGLSAQEARFNKVAEITKYEKEAIDEQERIMTKYRNEQYRIYLQEREDLQKFLKLHTYENRDKDIFAQLDLNEDRNALEEELALKREELLRARQDILNELDTVSESQEIREDHQEASISNTTDKELAKEQIPDEQYLIIEIPGESDDMSDIPDNQHGNVAETKPEKGLNKKFGRSKSMQPRFSKKPQLDTVKDTDTEDSGISDNAAGTIKQTKDEFFGLIGPRVNKSGSELSSDVPSDYEKNNDESIVRGIINRKHEIASGGKRAEKRSWTRLYAALQNREILFYKDRKQYHKGILLYHVSPLSVTDCRCSVASDYKKRKNVFRLRLRDGSQYLFQATNNEDMCRWIDNILLTCTDTSDDKGCGSQGDGTSSPRSTSNIEVVLPGSDEAASTSPLNSDEKSPLKRLNFFKKK